MQYYLDTSIWIDFFENRNENHMSKGDIAQKLLQNIIQTHGVLVISDCIVIELKSLGYDSWMLDYLMEPFKHHLRYVQSHVKHINRARDIAAKRHVPVKDALHALLARDAGATLVATDRHFRALTDLVRVREPSDLG